MTLKEAERKYKITYPESFRKVCENNVPWITHDMKWVTRHTAGLEKTDKELYHFFFFILPFAEIENAIEAFSLSLENDYDYKIGSLHLNRRYKYIPFAKCLKRDYYMFVYDRENPKAEPAVAGYHTKEAVMYVCEENFHDFVLNKFLENTKGYSDKMLDTVASFLNEEYAALIAQRDFDTLHKLYVEYNEKWLPFLIPAEEAKYKESEEKETPESLIISLKSKKLVINYNDIRYIEANSKNILIRSAKKTEYCNRLISFVENILPGNLFFRTHKSFIVGFKNIVSHTNKEVIFDNGEKALISKRKLTAFRERYSEYLRGVSN